MNVFECGWWLLHYGCKISESRQNIRSESGGRACYLKCASGVSLRHDYVAVRHCHAERVDVDDVVRGFR